MNNKKKFDLKLYLDILHNKKFYISTIIVGTYTFVSFVLTENFKNS